MNPIRDEWRSDDGSVRLILGDCLEVLPTLDQGSVSLVVTSPPYNMGSTPWNALGHWRPGHKCSGGEGKWKRGGASSARGVAYDVHNDSMPWGDYVQWQRDVISCLWSVLSDDGAIFYNHKPRVVGEQLWLPLELVPDGVPVRQIISWDRGGGINYTVSAFVPMQEWILVLAKPNWRLKSCGVSGLGDVWRFPPDSGNSHPAPFPLGIPARAIDATKFGTVCDPYFGSGTTAVAAVRQKRPFVGCEVNPRYFADAIERVQEELDRFPLLELKRPRQLELVTS